MSIAKILNESSELCKQRKYLEAYELLNSIQGGQKTNEELYLYYRLLGLCYNERNELEQAICYYLKSLRIAKDNNMAVIKMDIFYELSVTNFKLFQQKKQIDICKKQ